MVSQGADTAVTSDKVSDSLVSQGADTAVTSDKVSDRPAEPESAPGVAYVEARTRL